jgi:hypothetical protein
MRLIVSPSNRFAWRVNVEVWARDIPTRMERDAMAFAIEALRPFELFDSLRWESTSGSGEWATFSFALLSKHRTKARIAALQAFISSHR